MMLQSPSSSITTTARRSARVSRISNGSSSTAVILTSRRKGKRREFNKAPTRRWAQVLRPPQPGVSFKTLTWVPLEGLTTEERQTYDDNEGKKKKMKANENLQPKGIFPTSEGGEIVADESTSVLPAKSNVTCEDIVVPATLKEVEYSVPPSKSLIDEGQKSIKSEIENEKDVGYVVPMQNSSDTAERLCKKPKQDNDRYLLQKTSIEEGKEGNRFDSHLDKKTDGDGSENIELKAKAY